MGDARFDKTYDGNANATTALTKGTNYTLTNFAPGEGADIELAAVTGTYADKNAGVDKAVNFGDLTLSGAGAANYKLNVTNLTGVGTIAPKDLALALKPGANFDKTYDGTPNVTQPLTKDGNYTLTDFIGAEGDRLSLAPVTGQ